MTENQCVYASFDQKHDDIFMQVDEELQLIDEMDGIKEFCAHLFGYYNVVVAIEKYEIEQPLISFMKMNENLLEEGIHEAKFEHLKWLEDHDYMKEEATI